MSVGTKESIIHPTAIVDPAAEISAGVSIGPYAVVGANVRIGQDTEVGPHVILDGHTTIGERNRIFPYAIIGTEPQDKKYTGSPTTVEIGDDNIIREFVLIKTGTETGGWTTRIGSRNLLMANSSVAHDCVLHDDIILANGAGLAGHVTIESHAVLGGMTGVHQFVRIGKFSITGGGSMVVMDVAPFCMVAGNRARMYSLNQVGLDRGPFEPEDIAALKAAHRTIFRSKKSFQDAVASIRETGELNPHVQYLVEFLESSERGFCR